MKRMWLFIPLAILMATLGLIFVLYHSLEYEHDSPMVGQEMPVWTLVGVENGEQGPADLKGQRYILHIGSSWCETCQNEHKYLEELAQTGIPLVGLFYKDTPKDVSNFLEKRSDPYQMLFIDVEGKSMVYLGALALPSTYIVDENGIIEEVISGPLQSSHQVTRFLP